MQSEKAVKFENRLLRNIDRRTQGVVTGLAVRHNNVETVGGAPLEDDDQALRPDSRSGSAKRGAGEETRERGGADNCQRAVAEKNSSSDRHQNQPSAVSHQPSGRLRFETGRAA